MKLFFLDDARQRKPSRAGMGSLIAVGGISLTDSAVGDLEKSIDSLCRTDYGFPPGEEFKWSPGRELWMRNNLTGDRRFNFFKAVIQVVLGAGCKAFVVIADCNHARATKAATPELDVAKMCLERVCNECGQKPDGLVIADRALAGSPEDKFLADCLESLEAGSGYLRPNALAINVVSTNSKFIRLLQVADVITGATLAAVAGETRYSLAVLHELKPMYRQSAGCIGGYGVKIHPDYRYVNLYYWIFGDQMRWRLNAGLPLPDRNRPYSKNANRP